MATADDQDREFHELIQNVMSMRTEWLQQFTDPRRNINKECGLPEGRLSRDHYYLMYDREPVAARVVEVLAKESWQVIPEVYEDEDPQTITPFEGAWADLPKFLSSTKSYFDTKAEQGGTVWEYLQRLDVQCGIGQFGVLLLGIDDGKPLWTPVEGVEEEGSTFSPENPEVKGKGVEDGYTPAGQLWDGVGPFPRRKYSLKLNGLDYGQQFTLNAFTPPKPGAGAVGPPQPSVTPAVAVPRTDDPYKKTEPKKPPEWKPKTPLRYLRVFPELLADVVSFETNRASPRFGQPVEYLLTLNDPRFGDSYGGIGLTTATVRVHWTRVIHVADNVGACEWAGMPRMQQVYNNLVGLQKLYHGSPEMYWRGAFPGLSIETHPQLGGDVKVQKEELRGGMEKYMNGLQRYLLLMGMSAKTLAPQVVDPTPQVMAQLQAICIKLGVPQRVFMGSERGELASSQDDAAWNDRLMFRQKNFITPKIVVPFVDRLIALGVLPPPAENGKLCVEWPDLTSMTEGEKADVANKKTTALAAYVSGGIDALIEPVDYLTSVMEYDDEEARQMIERAAAHAEEKQQVQMDQQQAQIDAGLALDPQEQADKAHEVALVQAKNQPAGGGPPGAAGPKPPGALAGGKTPSFVKNERAFNYDPSQPRDKGGQWTTGGGGLVARALKEAEAVKFHRGGGPGGKDKWMEDDDSMHYVFDTPGDTYSISLTSNSGLNDGTPVHELMFGGTKGGVKPSGKGHAVQVFRTVLAAAVAAVQKRGLQAVSFSALDDGSGRQKLYDRLARAVVKLVPGYKALALTTFGKRNYIVVKDDKASMAKDHLRNTLSLMEKLVSPTEKLEG